jgi:hypothetical protein
MIGAAMRSPSRNLKAVAMVCLAVAVSAAAASGAGTREFKDKSHSAYTVGIKVSGSSVQAANLIVNAQSFLHCDNGPGSVVGGWGIRNAKVTNGHFRASASGSRNDFNSYQVSLQGKIKGDTVTGSASLRLYYSGTKAGSTYQCWSGKSKSKPAVPFVAKAK